MVIISHPEGGSNPIENGSQGVDKYIEFNQRHGLCTFLSLVSMRHKDNNRWTLLTILNQVLNYLISIFMENEEPPASDNSRRNRVES